MNSSNRDENPHFTFYKHNNEAEKVIRYDVYLGLVAASFPPKYKIKTTHISSGDQTSGYMTQEDIRDLVRDVGESDNVKKQIKDKKVTWY